MTAYYNEFDPQAAEWLRELIKGGHIAPGDVDERSIEDVRPDELVGYTQCHFFAGIGGWSLALRIAGWPDDRPVWTGSCPCQPFSAAGKGTGFDDERHLWPSFHWLIQQRQPTTVFGEQVASKATGPWFDLVQADLEGMGYAFGLVPFPAAGIGAPHIRDRAYWVGHREREGLEGFAWNGNHQEGRPEPDRPAPEAGSAVRMADSQSKRQHGSQDTAGETGWHSAQDSSEAGRLADHDSHGCDKARQRIASAGDDGSVGDSSLAPLDRGPGPTYGFWGATDWLHCRDGKWRPVEPGTFPLVDGLSHRVGLLRGYGNAIVPEQAAEFVMATGLIGDALICEVGA